MVSREYRFKKKNSSVKTFHEYNEVVCWVWTMCEPASHARHASHDCESFEPRWRVNMRITQLLKANRFKMGG